MNAEALQRVARALRDRLQQSVTAAGETGSVFVGPLDDPDAAGAPLVLFLYRVVPSASLRNREHRVVNGAPPPEVVTYTNSLPLDLFFLVTVGTRFGTPGEEPLLRVLGFAMQSLQSDPDLTGAGLQHETVHVTMEPLTTEESGRIWALFPTINFRTSVAYLATPVWIDPPMPPAPAAPVTEDSLKAGALPEATG